MADCCSASPNAGKCISCWDTKKCDATYGGTAPNCNAGYSVCCQTDADCPVKDNRIGECVGNICWWGPCRINNDCIVGSCCTNQPDGTIEGNCTDPNNRIYNNKWLCDPPEWKSLENNERGNLNIFQELFYFIAGLFKSG